MSNVWKLFDFLNSRQENVMQKWADSRKISKRDRGRIDFKVKLLETKGDELPTGLLQDTRCKSIKELATGSQIAYRLMLCRGPVEMNKEFTFLLGATERDNKYVPKNAPERADKNRLDLMENIKRRCSHEPFF